MVLPVKRSVTDDNPRLTSEYSQRRIHSADPGFFLVHCRVIKINARKSSSSRTFDPESTHREAYRHVSRFLRSKSHIEASDTGTRSSTRRNIPWKPREPFDHKAPTHRHTKSTEPHGEDTSEIRITVTRRDPPYTDCCLDRRTVRYDCNDDRSANLLNRHIFPLAAPIRSTRREHYAVSSRTDNAGQCWPAEVDRPLTEMAERTASILRASTDWRPRGYWYFHAFANPFCRRSNPTQIKFFPLSRVTVLESRSMTFSNL